ncbi:organic cation transporter protein-like isoform X2 [Dendronephthya gigantea]|nr:organic cation transporter protein-like isoform X2 [Dendronephthya gigantea]
MMGALLGGLVLGMLADKYGRRPSWCISYILMVLGGVATAFSTSLNVLYVARLVAGVGTGGALLTGFVLVTELIGPSYRGITGALSSCFFTFGQMLLPAFAYFLQDWRKLSFILSLVGVIFTFFIRSVPESPRWLMIVGRVSEAEDILSETALYNGLALPKTLLQIGRPMQLSRSYHGCLELFRNCYIAKKTIVISSIWFINSLVYYGLSFNTKNIDGNIFLNFFLSSIIELPAYFISFSIINWIGRKRSVFYCMTLSGAACLACLFVQTGGLSSYSPLVTATAVLGKFGIAASFSILHIFSAELFPTVVRNIGLGLCSMAARVGAIVAPMIVFLGSYTRPLPMMIFGMGAFTAAFFSLMLDETLNRPLSETLEDDLPNQELGDYLHYKQLNTAAGSPQNEDVEENVFALVDSDVENDFPIDEKRTFI